MTNEAAERLTLNQKLIRALHPGTDWDQYDREVRRATVERAVDTLEAERALMLPGTVDRMVYSRAISKVRAILDEEAAR